MTDEGKLSIFKKIMTDSNKNVKEINLESHEEELKKRAPGFSEEVKVEEQIQHITYSENIDEIIGKEIDARLKIIDEFISKKLAEVDSRLREVERFSTKMENIESKLIKIDSELNKLRELSDERWIDLGKEIHRIESTLKQQIENIKKEFEDKWAVNEMKINTMKDQVNVIDKELTSVKESSEKLKQLIRELSEKVASKILEFQEIRKTLYDQMVKIEDQISSLKMEVNTVNSLKDRISSFKKELENLEKELELLVQSSQPQVVFQQSIEVKKPEEVKTEENVPENVEAKIEEKKEEGKKEKHISIFGRKKK